MDDFNYNAVSRLEVAQIVVFLESAFSIEDDKCCALSKGERTRMPGSTMEFERACPIDEEGGQASQIQIAIFSRRCNRNHRARSTERNENLLSALMPAKKIKLEPSCFNHLRDKTGSSAIEVHIRLTPFKDQFAIR